MVDDFAVASRLLEKFRKYSNGCKDASPPACLKIHDKNLHKNTAEDNGEVMSAEERNSVGSSLHDDNHVDLSRVKVERNDNDNSSQVNKENNQPTDEELYRASRKNYADDERKSSYPRMRQNMTISELLDSYGKEDKNSSHDDDYEDSPSENNTTGQRRDGRSHLHEPKRESNRRHDDDRSSSPGDYETTQRRNERVHLYQPKYRSSRRNDYRSSAPAMYDDKNRINLYRTKPKSGRHYGHDYGSSAPIKYDNRDYDDRPYRRKRRNTENYEDFSRVKRERNDSYNDNKEDAFGRKYKGHLRHDDRVEPRSQHSRHYDEREERRIQRPVMKKFPNLVCKFYREGCCRDSAEVCQYSHNVFESHRLPELCPLYMTGSCREGLACKYLHGEFPCKDFFLGKCHMSNCRLSHEPLNWFSKRLFEKALELEKSGRKRSFALPQRKTLLSNAAPKPLIEPLMSKPIELNMNRPSSNRHSFYDSKPTSRQAFSPYTTSHREHPQERPLDEILSSEAFNISEIRRTYK